MAGRPRASVWSMSQNTAASATELARSLPALEHPDGSRIQALVVDDEGDLHQ